MLALCVARSHRSYCSATRRDRLHDQKFPCLSGGNLVVPQLRIRISWEPRNPSPSSVFCATMRRHKCTTLQCFDLTNVKRPRRLPQTGSDEIFPAKNHPPKKRTHNFPNYSNTTLVLGVFPKWTLMFDGSNSNQCPIRFTPIFTPRRPGHGSEPPTLPDQTLRTLRRPGW